MLIDLDSAKRHLRITNDAQDERVHSKVVQASAIVRDYLKVDADEWDIDDTSAAVLPYEIEAAALLVLEALHDGSTEPLSDAVKSLLHRHRDPALA